MEILLEMDLLKINMARLEDFRIGNYYENWLGETMQMTKENFVHFATADNYYFRPITVNEKWIDDLGLFNNYKFEDVGVNIKDQSSIYFYGSDLFLPMPEYVHKLQNLVYEVTGKELERYAIK